MDVTDTFGHLNPKQQQKTPRPAELLSDHDVGWTPIQSLMLSKFHAPFRANPSFGLNLTRVSKLAAVSD